MALERETSERMPAAGQDCPHLITSSLFHQHNPPPYQSSSSYSLLMRGRRGGGGEATLSHRASSKTSLYAQSVHMSSRLQSMIRNSLPKRQLQIFSHQGIPFTSWRLRCTRLKGKNVLIISARRLFNRAKLVSSKLSTC